MSLAPTADIFFAHALQQLRQEGLDAAVEWLAGREPHVAAQVYRKLQSHLYWTNKDLPATIAVSRAGIHQDLAAGASADVRGVAKQLAFNLDSFTWPGWDEPDIRITPADLAVGRWAAGLNLRLADALGRPDDVRANALWLVAAHQMADGQLAAAAGTFRSAEAHAALAGTPVAGHMLRAYAALADLLADWSNAMAAAALTAEVDALTAAGTDDALEYARQVRVAHNWFGRTAGDADPRTSAPQT